MDGARRVLAWFRRRYGAGPLHLLSLLTTFAFVGYVATRILGSVNWGWILVWFAGAVIGHDLVLWPLYTVLDRALVRAGRRRHPSSAGPSTADPPGDQPQRPARWINHVRVPVVMSALLLAISFPLVLRLAPGNYEAATGLTPNVYLGRWLLVSGILFAASAALYVLRVAWPGRRG